MNFQNQEEERRDSDLQIKQVNLEYLDTIRRFSWNILTSEFKISSRHSFITRAEAIKNCEYIAKQLFNKDINDSEWIT